MGPWCKHRVTPKRSHFEKGTRDRMPGSVKRGISSARALGRPTLTRSHAQHTSHHLARFRPSSAWAASCVVGAWAFSAASAAAARVRIPASCQVALISDQCLDSHMRILQALGSGQLTKQSTNAKLLIRVAQDSRPVKPFTAWHRSLTNKAVRYGRHPELWRLARNNGDQACETTGLAHRHVVCCKTHADWRAHALRAI